MHARASNVVHGPPPFEVANREGRPAGPVASLIPQRATGTTGGPPGFLVQLNKDRHQLPFGRAASPAKHASALAARPGRKRTVTVTVEAGILASLRDEIFACRLPHIRLKPSQWGRFTAHPPARLPRCRLYREYTPSGTKRLSLACNGLAVTMPQRKRQLSVHVTALSGRFYDCSITYSANARAVSECNREGLYLPCWLYDHLTDYFQHDG
jgi:hypothetical protein